MVKQSENNFKIPLKASAEFPVRKTFCMSGEMAKTLEDLESKHEVDIPQLIRDGLEIHLKKVVALLNPPITLSSPSVLEVNLDSHEINPILDL